MSDSFMELHEFSSETAFLWINISDERIKKLANDLTFISHNAEVRLMYYANLCYQMEQFFSEQFDERQKSFSEIGKKINESKKDMDDFEKEYSESQFVQQQFLVYERIGVQEDAVAIGIFLKAYSLLERVMNQICDIYKELKNLNTSYKDLEGGGIVRASIYIQQAVNINNASKEEWQLLRCWNNIRNQIMHEDAITTNDQRLLRSMSRLGIRSKRDTTVPGAEILDIKLNHIRKFLVLVDKNLANYVLHKNRWN